MHPSHKLIWIPSLVILAVLAAVLVWAFSTTPGVYAKPELASGPDSSAGWRIGEAVSYETLTVFPVLSSQEAYTADFETLDAALASGAAIVAEQGEYMRRSRDGGESSRVISSGPKVNQLVLVNRGKKPLLLLAGEVVSGGKQDRIIDKGRIIPAGAHSTHSASSIAAGPTAATHSPPGKPWCIQRFAQKPPSRKTRAKSGLRFVVTPRQPERRRACRPAWKLLRRRFPNSSFHK